MSSNPESAHERSQRRLIQFVLLPVLFFFGVKLSLAFAVLPGVLVMLWLPNSLLLAALLHYGTRGYACFAAAILAVQIVADYPTFGVLQALLFGAINLIEASVAYLLLRRWRFNPGFVVPSDIAKFLIAATGIGALIAACLAAAVYKYFRVADGAYLELVRVWWYSDAIGLLILTPLVLSLWPVSHSPHERLPLRWFDAAVALAAVMVLAAFALADRAYLYGMQVRPVLLFPFVVYAAARLTMRATTFVTALYAGVILFVTKNGQQPFGDMASGETVHQVQQFVYLMTATSLALSALLSQLRANARELDKRVQERTAELRAANDELQKLTVTDPLTGLLNRRVLGNLMRREVERSLRHQHDLAVIMFDLDHFKRVNDQYGHPAGDALLRHVAGVAAGSLRGTDVLARYGGEEFLILAPETDLSEARRLAERVREAIASSPATFENQDIAITASFGAALLNAQDPTPEALIGRADAALYAAKAAGRNRVAVDCSTSADGDENRIQPEPREGATKRPR